MKFPIMIATTTTALPIICIKNALTVYAKERVGGGAELYASSMPRNVYKKRGIKLIIVNK